jgi:threonine/homoserine/homoserine lactone efflux protein
MTLQLWLMYLTLVFVATATPGPAVLFIMTNSTLHGWRKAVFAALGNICGLLWLGIMSVAGVGTILKTSEMLFNVIKFAGAAYLAYLGVKLLLQKGWDLSAAPGGPALKKISGRQIFLQAFGVAVSNPKAIVFLTALFPQFVDVSAPLAPQFFVLIAVLMGFSFFFLMGYALLAHKAKTWLAGPFRAKAVTRTSGSIFIGFGILLAASSNR